MPLEQYAAASSKRKNRFLPLREKRKHDTNSRLRFESLEDRRLLAATDLGPLAASGDDTAEFAKVGNMILADSVATKQSLSSGKLAARGRKAFSIDDVSVVEGDSGDQTPATFTVTRSGDTSKIASVVVQTVDSSATASSGDYVAVPSTTLTFDPGTASLPVEVLINGDKDPNEVDETFFVDLSSPFGATIKDGQGQGTIEDDDNSGPAPSEIYVDAFFAEEPQTRGRQVYHRFTVVAKKDFPDQSGSFGTEDANDVAAEGATVAVGLFDLALEPGQHDYIVQQFVGTTDENGVFTTRGLKGLEPEKEYLVEVVLMDLNGFVWNPEPNDGLEEEVDHDNDGIPSFPYVVPVSAAAFSLVDASARIATEDVLAVTRVNSAAKVGIGFSWRHVGNDSLLLEQQSSLVKVAYTGLAKVHPVHQDSDPLEWLSTLALGDALIELLAQDSAGQSAKSSSIDELL